MNNQSMSLPSNWTEKPLKYCCTINAHTLPESTRPDLLINYIDIGSVNSFGEIFEVKEFTFEDAPSRARRVVKMGDTIVSTVRTYLRAIAYIDDPLPNLICSTGFAVLESNEGIDKKYLYYLLSSAHVVDEIVSRSVGVSYPAINPTEFGNIPCIIPPIDTQRAISSFLDKKLGRVMTLIDELKIQTKLQLKRKQALITIAVTKGLDSNVPMKDSGIEWLGEVPEHWEIAPLKYNVQINRDKLPESTPPDWNLNYIDISNVSLCGEILGIQNMSFGSAPSRARRKVSDGDTIISTVRTYLRAIAHIQDSEENLICSTGFAVLTPSAKFHPKFLYYWVSSRGFVDEVVSNSMGVSYPAINSSQIGSLAGVVPPWCEQEQIASYLDSRVEQLNTISKKIQQEIALLEEYRQSLIYHAVTGKIDVRKEAS